MLLLNAVIAGLTWIMNIVRNGKQEHNHQVIYDNLSLLAPDRREALIQDLSARAGLEVTRVEVGDLNLLRDTASLTITCKTERRRLDAPTREQSDSVRTGHDPDVAMVTSLPGRG